MSHPVKQYFASWDMDDHRGKIILHSSTGSILGNYKIASSTEFAMILDLLRSEKPLSLHNGLQLLETGLEPVGEDE